MDFSTETQLTEFGRKLGQQLLRDFISPTSPRVIELIGDVGAGKTTFTRGIADGLGVKEPVTSPSFTIAKRYAFTLPTQSHSTPASAPSNDTAYLTHYDFYRLSDPGLMSEDLAESIADKNTIVILEWANTVEDLLPENRLIYQITINDDGSRHLHQINKPARISKEK